MVSVFAFTHTIRVQILLKPTVFFNFVFEKNENEQKRDGGWPFFVNVVWKIIKTNKKEAQVLKINKSSMNQVPPTPRSEASSGPDNLEFLDRLLNHEIDWKKGGDVSDDSDDSEEDEFGVSDVSNNSDNHIVNKLPPPPVDDDRGNEKNLLLPNFVP